MSAVTLREPQPPTDRELERSASEIAACELRVLKLTDGRSDPSMLGSVAGRVVRSPGQGSDWIASVLRTGMARQKVGYTLAPAPPVSQRVVPVEVALVTAWVSSVSVAKSSNVVLAVTYLGADDARVERVYRGSHTGPNWSSGEGEIQAMVDAAFEDAITKLGSDVRARCGG